MLFTSIKTRLTIFVLLLFTVLTVATALTALLFFERQIKDEVVLSQRLLLSAVVSQLDDRIYSGQQALKAVAGIIAPAVGNPVAARKILEQNFDILNSFNDTLFLLSATGRVIAATPKELNAPGTDLSYREYFQRTVATGKPCISEPFLSVLRSNRTIIMFTQPVFDQKGTLIAVLGGGIDISAQKCFKSLATAKVGRDGFFSLYDAKQTMLIHPDRDRLLQNRSGSLPGRGLRGAAGNEEIITRSGLKVIRSVDRLKSTGWVIAVSYPVAEAYQPIYTARRYFVGGGIIAVVLSGLLVWCVMGYLTGPLLTLTRHIRGLLAGGGERSLVAIDSQDEIGNLAKVFNKLLVDLDHTNSTLAESQWRYKQLFMHNPNPMWVYDLETLKFLNVNEAAVQHYGYSREQFLDMTIKEIRPGEDIPALIENVAAVTKGIDAAGVWRHTKMDGSIIQVAITSHAMEYAGRPAELVLANDVTEQKLAEDALRQSEERYRSIFEGVRDIIYTISADWTFLSLNGEFERISGWSRNEWIGRSFVDLIHPEDLPLVVDAFQASLRGEEFLRFEARLRQKSGAFVSVEINSTHYLQNGKVASVLGIARDISERRQAEEERAKLELQVRHMQKMEALGTLTGGVAHDFNNILTAIMGFANLTLTQLDRGSPLGHYLLQITAATDKASALVRALLAYSRKQPFAPKPVLINDILTGTAKLISRVIGDGIELSTRLADERLVVMADAGQVEQVLMNLATNARDAMSGTGVLCISTARAELDEQFVQRQGYGEAGGYACVGVSDTGVGMDAGILERIFEPFFTTKEVGKGTGLGLSMLYGIVKQHGGYVTVRSEIGRGTNFELYFPLTSAISEQPTAQLLSLPRQGSETILLVEDNEAVRHLFRELLQKGGYTVIDAKDGEEGLDKFSFNSREVELLIVDKVMPKKTGKEVYRSVKKVRDDLPVLYVSGYSADTVDVEDAGNGEYFICKPVSPTDLLAKVRKILDDHARRHISRSQEPLQWQTEHAER